MLVDLLVTGIFMISFTCTIFQLQGCSQGTLWLGARGDVCLNGRGLKPVSGHPRHKDREQGSDNFPSNPVLIEVINMHMRSIVFEIITKQMWDTFLNHPVVIELGKNVTDDYQMAK